ncbi:hypothetical protein GCM10027019_31360 [Melaminivora jejuensis]|uniref:hypothetical protein n=1 Tax=Melaminivora jejuensis TaxID=1267217 RepID=UPI001AE0548A|nr:hypothetical protein [Melaminivora jejuensis]UHJ63558.1 hypothetical protein LVC68_08870 [Melaminivora jejuensis]
MKEVFALNAANQTSPEAGEVWLAKFSFEEGGSYKVRPVLLLESRPYGCKAAFVGTQKLDSTSSRCDVLLDDEQAQAIGLQRASRLCFDNHRVLSPADLLRPLGKLGVPGQNLPVGKFREMAEAVQAAGVL